MIFEHFVVFGSIIFCTMSPQQMIFFNNMALTQSLTYNNKTLHDKIVAHAPDHTPSPNAHDTHHILSHTPHTHHSHHHPQQLCELFSLSLTIRAASHCSKANANSFGSPDSHANTMGSMQLSGGSSAPKEDNMSVTTCKGVWRKQHRHTHGI